MLKHLMGFLFFAMVSGNALAEVSGKEVAYSADGVTMKGYLVTNTELKDKGPAILVVHEWWGQDDYARKRATMLAELGYTALAIDMYGDGKQAKHPDEAGKFATEISKNMPGAVLRFSAAMDLLKSQSNVDPEKIAAIGYCFGGGVVLEMARRGLDLKAVASFHGGLSPTGEKAEEGKVKARVLVLNGADDPMTTQQQINAFTREMADAKVYNRFYSFTGAKHSFTNPDADKYGAEFKMPLAYNADADKESWALMKSFLTEAFKQ